ncbi:MAG: hybrid sensor histidine kinase/response regulator [bacterium]
MDYSKEVTAEIFKIFQVESEEIISKLNNSLLELEKNPKNKDAILMLFRDAHTLKGASRMVGFNSVQIIAHKMEDILGLAKENKISLTSNVVNVLYKTVDFLAEIIQKSIQKGQEIYNENIPKHIAILEELNKDAEEAPFDNEQPDFDFELFVKNIGEINTLVPESLLILMQIETGKSENLIINLLFVVRELHTIFEKIGLFEIKKSFEDICLKLDFTSQASNILTNDEIAEIHKVLDSIINQFIAICELHNIELVDYYSVAFEKLSSPLTLPRNSSEHNVEIIQEEQTSDISQNKDATINDDLAIINNKIWELLNSGSSIVPIKSLLLEYENICPNSNIKSILQKIIEIIDFACENEIQFEQETVSVLKQSIEYCDDIIKNKSDSADKVLILQRLEIVQQVLTFNKEKIEEGSFITKKGAGTKGEKISDFSEIFNTGTIKTLRVDSSKLDVLINQVSELTTTKIKTKKHLHELSLINKELEEWQRNLTKTFNYLKYYDKKYFQSGISDSPISFFVKQILTLFTDNNKKVQETVLNITSLHRMIQEDDAKMNVIVGSVENMVQNIRVLPLATIFHLFGRMVRDIAQEKNKKIELEIVGSETSTDKKIIEEIKTPLIHIIRNAIDHGIETPKERIELGKKPEGKIILSARQSNHKVIIEIKDDGRGINLAKIKEKALQEGFLTQEEINLMTDEQIINIIFSPGFTTVAEITNLSGRGIGLDIVQTKISQLNGRVKVFSEINKGCCVQIELPTTMSTLKAFLVKSSDQTFAVPMEVIKTVLRKKKEEILSSTGTKSIIFGEKTIPLYNLTDILNLPKPNYNTDRETILIIESDDKIMALAVDKLIGDQEILHKKLSAPFYKLKNISGITALVSGEICLILNITDIINITKLTKLPSNSSSIKKVSRNKDYKILLVDDSITTRAMEKNILTQAGYNVETAENPLGAFDKMKNIKFDLIISDIEMPEMDGFEFLERLKTDEMYADIPVIMVSSLVSEENKKRARVLGAQKYIVKSEFKQESFQKIIEEILHEGN